MSEKYLDRLLQDRSRALRPEAVLQGISTGDMGQGVKELESLCMVLTGHLVEMQMDGSDLRSKVGTMLLRARAIIDTLEAMNSRTLHDADGVIA